MPIASAAAVPTIAAFVLFVFGVYPLANRLSNGDAAPWYRHAFLFWLFIGVPLLMCLLATARWQGERVDRMWRAASERALRIPAPVFVGAAALFAMAVSTYVAVVCFGRQPHNSDEVAQLFHAKILLSGRLALPADPNPEFFGMDNMIDRNRWYSQFPIGGPAFLALGLLFRGAWLVNPVLLALTAPCLFAFARRAYGEPLARAAVLLFALCPLALFMGASFMNHVPVLWLASVAMWQLAVWMDAASQRDANRAAALLGLAVGVAFTVRPLDALVVAGVIGVMQLAHLRGAPHRRRALALQIGAGLLPLAILFYANYRTNGSPLTLGYEVLYGSAHQLGFHTDPYGTMHTPLRALTFASKYLLRLNVLLFEWPLPAVAIIVAGLLALRRPGKWDYLMLGLLFAQVAAYAFYWHDGAFRGPRFLFTALPAIVLLTARAPFLIAEVTKGTTRRLAILAVPGCVLFAWLAFGIGDTVIGRARQYRSGSAITRVDPVAMANANGLHNALVFINEGHHARNFRYLWALGLSRGNAARLMVSASSCAVRMSIDAEEALRPARTSGRLDRLVRGALANDRIAFLPARCAEDARRDDEGSASYAPFFPANTITSDGRVGGDVVYVLDLGEHNETLRPRFGARRWYRFGRRQTPGDSLPTLMAYTQPPR